ncbi:hypothetical protein JTE90_018827 [Oedothorax gibbosus]|uniref:Uncharacterized protein n=1 Tax=Oedothorax gibbosus TaxID=931172 RepID=A0AAV6UWN0_9ARAC|nr:hypothetical protein JTE90_018827 [Oedothorax gibbosus]
MLAMHWSKKFLSSTNTSPAVSTVTFLSKINSSKSLQTLSCCNILMQRQLRSSIVDLTRRSSFVTSAANIVMTPMMAHEQAIYEVKSINATIVKSFFISNNKEQKDRHTIFCIIT